MSRRGHGEGSIYRRKDGRWAASVEVGTTGGKRQRKTIYGRTRREVATRLHEALQTQRSGGPLPKERTTVASFLDDWLVSLKPTVAFRTYQKYESVVRLHLKPALGSRRLTKLEPVDLQRLYAERLSAGQSPRSVVHIHRVLSSALSQAAKWDLVVRNVATLVTPPRVPRKPVETLTKEEAAMLFEVARGHRLEALFVVAITTGMREGELLGLRWGDVDLGRRTLHVQGALQRTEDGTFQVTEPKTAASLRRISLSGLATDALRRHRSRQNEERLSMGTGWRDEDLVFASTVGGPINPTNMYRRAFKPLLKAAGLRQIRFHDLRHTCATLLLADGVNVKVVSELLGHSDITVTLNTYAHVLPTIQQQATDAFDAMLAAKAVNLAVNDGAP